MSGHNQFALLRQRRFLPFFVVQALGAFNDNVYRQAIISMLLFMAVPEEELGLYATLAPAIFILPYFLFSALAGQIADKLEKSRLIVITTTMEIVIMSLAATGFLTQSLPVLLVALFCTGMQSTLFGPVKYSVLPSVLKPEELTGGNGLVEMGTSIAILTGMIVGGLMFALPKSFTIGGREFFLPDYNGDLVAACTIIGLAICGNIAARLIPKVDAGDPGLKINWNPLPESLAVLRMARQQKAVRNAILGVSWFWFVGTVLTSQLPAYAVTNLGGEPTLYIFALALFSVGTGIGSLLCEKLSARTVEIGLVPLGAFGMTAFLLDLYFARSGEASVHGLTIGPFLQQPGSIRIVIDLVGIGLFTGIFVVPLFALIQSRTPKAQMSRVFAALNIQNSGFIVAAALLSLAAHKLLHWTIPQQFLALAIANALVAIYIFTIVPEFLMRFLSWLMVRTLYRLRPHGIEANVPDEGAALLVCNHVSYMDALILSATIPRPVRFVMYYKIFNIPVMRWIFRTAKAIPIAGAREDPALMQRAFDEIDAALAEGELVCIFPEGALTRDGQMAPFKSGVEKILERRPVPVVPMALRGMWSSMWSRRDSRLGRMRVPRRFRATVEVVAAPAVDGHASTAPLLEAQVRALRGDHA
ncbi:TPA: MFS transporter [Stenotrophomonas maltophilia]|nr:MFS transporter [Stenotrophomonas maltophilia]